MQTEGILPPMAINQIQINWKNTAMDRLQSGHKKEYQKGGIHTPFWLMR